MDSPFGTASLEEDPTNFRPFIGPFDEVNAPIMGVQLMADGQVSSEERLLQGHHRQSASRSLRLYSRDDVHGQLAFHKKLIESVRRGRRFVTPQHRGGQLPVVEPAVQIEFFRKTSMERQWQCFDFNKPVEVPDSPQPPADQDDPSMSESSDSSSSSDSSDSEVSKEATTRAAKRPIRWCCQRTRLTKCWLRRFHMFSMP